MKRFITSLLLILILSGCGGPPPPLPPGAVGPEIVEDGAVFRYHDPSAKSVFLVGDFNNWDATLDPFNDENGDGEWTLFYPLLPGTYSYKFVVDAKRWIPDPTNPLSEPDGFDGDNSVIKVPEAYNL
ncbi:MAG: hypothetical protein IH969_09850 [Candidatus Krumholzibacteriota bacterium]|nr:hypothetical protein [Candidatus Krumholzibacteriota bacterium]